MNRKIISIVLALSLVVTWVGLGVAGGIGYYFRDQERGFAPRPQKISSGVMAADALIGRPLGVACTALGTSIFIVTLPTSLASSSTEQAFRGLVQKPAGWTFVRPLGPEGLAPQFEERGLFGD